MANSYFMSSLDSKGRTTIPPEILQQIGLPEGGSALFSIREDGVIVLSANPKGKLALKTSTGKIDCD